MTTSQRNCVGCAVRGPQCFCSLTFAALSALDGMGSRVRLDAGDRILYEGDQPSRVFIVCEGTIKISATSSEGRVLILRIAGPGDVLGLAPALKGGAHQTSATTIEQCELKAIPRKQFLEFMDSFQDASHNTAVSLATEYETAMMSARRLALSGSAAGKLASVLVDWGKLRSGAGTKVLCFRMPLTHEELGSMAGLSRETVTRLLSKFRLQGWVEQRGDVMTLLDPLAMEALYS